MHQPCHSEFWHVWQFACSGVRWAGKWNVAFLMVEPRVHKFSCHNLCTKLPASWTFESCLRVWTEVWLVCSWWTCNFGMAHKLFELLTCHLHAVLKICLTTRCCSYQFVAIYSCCYCFFNYSRWVGLFSQENTRHVMLLLNVAEIFHRWQPQVIEGEGRKKQQKERGQNSRR